MAWWHKVERGMVSVTLLRSNTSLRLPTMYDSLILCRFGLVCRRRDIGVEARSRTA